MRIILANLAKSMIIVVGGSSEGKEMGCLSTCEATSSIFTPFAPYTNGMVKPRRGPAIMQAGDGDVAVIGGCSQPGIHLGDMEIMQQQQWNSVSLHEGGFSCAAYCQLGNLCFIAGGYNGRECLNQVHLINPSTREVSLLKPLSSPLKNAAALAIGEGSQQSMLLFGGWDEKRTLNTVFQYSLHDQSCRLIQLMPRPLEGLTATYASPQYAYIIGGFDGIAVTNNIFQFDFQTKKFTQLEESLLTARENHATVVFTQHDVIYLLVIGGWDGYQALDSCEVFRVIERAPYLQREQDHRLKLARPNNKLAAIFMS